MAKKRLNQKAQAWVRARKRYRLSHAHVQMARELGMSPNKLGSLANHDQEPWKIPLRQYIEHLYERHFGRARPEVITSIEQRARRQEKKKAERRAAKQGQTIDRDDLISSTFE